MYKSPVVFIGVFYLFLAAFIIVGIFSLTSLVNDPETSYRFAIFMLLFIVVYMCYFTASISHKIEVWESGEIRLTSMRKIIDTKAEDIEYVEGPFLPLGFIRFRLEREKGYLFAFMKDASLNMVLSAIKTADPDIRFKQIQIMKNIKLE